MPSVELVLFRVFCAFRGQPRPPHNSGPRERAPRQGLSGLSVAAILLFSAMPFVAHEVAAGVHSDPKRTLANDAKLSFFRKKHD